MSGKHGANSWDDYLNVHQGRLADFAGHFLIGVDGWPTLGEVIGEAYDLWRRGDHG